MITQKSAEPVISLAGQAAMSADQAIKSTQRAASEALASVAQAATEIREDAVTPLMNRAARQASDMTARSVKAMREGSRQVRDSARRASATTVTYVKDEPVKSMLMAAAAGAALMALVNLLTRSRAGE